MLPQIIEPDRRRDPHWAFVSGMVALAPIHKFSRADVPPQEKHNGKLETYVRFYYKGGEGLVRETHRQS